MNIYLQQDGGKSGPFSDDELRQRIYSGVLSRTASACTEEQAGWVPLDTLLNQRPKAARSSTEPPPIATVAPRLRDPKERTALIWLYIASVPAWLFLAAWCVLNLGIPLVIFGFIWLVIAFGELWFAAYVKTNAVRVSPTQLPEVHHVVQTCCKRLGMACPDVYVMQHNVWNAFATRIFGRRMVVLFSGAVDSILLKGDMQQLTWLVGHELGHHWAGHLDLRQKLARLGGWLIWVALWHSRRAELTCDRVGMYCAASLKSSQLALMNATVGAQLASRVNLIQAANQWRQHRGEFFVKYRTLYATHPHLLARLEYMDGAAAELGLAA